MKICSPFYFAFTQSSCFRVTGFICVYADANTFTAGVVIHSLICIPMAPVCSALLCPSRLLFRKFSTILYKSNISKFKWTKLCIAYVLLYISVLFFTCYLFLLSNIFFLSRIPSISFPFFGCPLLRCFLLLLFLYFIHMNETSHEYVSFFPSATWTKRRMNMPLSFLHPRERNVAWICLFPSPIWTKRRTNMSLSCQQTSKWLDFCKDVNMMGTSYIHFIKSQYTVKIFNNMCLYA
jgi:hypothetical protein